MSIYNRIKEGILNYPFCFSLLDRNGGLDYLTLQYERDLHSKVASSSTEAIISLVYCAIPSRDKCGAFSS